MMHAIRLAQKSINSMFLSPTGFRNVTVIVLKVQWVDSPKCLIVRGSSVWLLDCMGHLCEVWMAWANFWAKSGFQQTMVCWGKFKIFSTANSPYCWSKEYVLFTKAFKYFDQCCRLYRNWSIYKWLICTNSWVLKRLIFLNKRNSSHIETFYVFKYVYFKRAFIFFNTWYLFIGGIM